MRLFIDTEFIETAMDIHLVSIALVSENGDKYYALNDARWNKELFEFLRAHENGRDQPSLSDG